MMAHRSRLAAARLGAFLRCLGSIELRVLLRIRGLGFRGRLETFFAGRSRLLQLILAFFELMLITVLEGFSCLVCLAVCAVGILFQSCRYG